MGRTASFLIKSEWFFFPMGAFFRWIGGVPVTRSSGSNLTDQMANEFHKRTIFQLAITPEGTRSLAKEWKKGFYYIAQKANVPICLVYLDYGKKEAGIFEYFHPTGDVQKDIEYIRSRYADVAACYPEKFAR